MNPQVSAEQTQKTTHSVIVLLNFFDELRRQGQKLISRVYIALRTGPLRILRVSRAWTKPTIRERRA